MTFSSNEQALLIIDILQRTPTGDNCQPFEYLIHESKNQISVFHNNKIAAHYLNPLNVASKISIGAMTYLLEKIKYSSNNKLTYSLNLQALETDELRQNILNISWENIDSQNLKNLYSDLCSIRTERVPPPNIFLPPFKLDIPQGEQIHSNFIEIKKLSPELLKLLLKAESALWCYKKLLADTLSWVVYPWNSSYKRGFSYYDIGMNLLESLSLIFLKRPFINQLESVRWVSRLRQILVTKAILKKSDGLLFLSSQDLKESTLLHLGAEFMALKINANNQGRCLQPLSIITFPIWMNAMLPEKNQLETLSVQNEFQKEFKSLLQMSTETLLWVLRVSPKLKGHHQTPRVSASEALVSK